MKLTELFKAFDYGNKGYLNYKEYEAMCYSLCKKPNSQEKMGSKIFIENLNDIEKQPDDLKEIFKYLSKNTGIINFENLKETTKNLKFSDDELKDMIFYFNENGIITYDVFKSIFSE